MSNVLFAAFIFSALRVSTPLILASLGGYFSERSGVVNIGLEGMMLIGAFGSAVAANATHNPWIGLFAGICCGMGFAVIHAFLCIFMKADQIISGMAINLLAMGLPPVICKSLYDMSSGTPSLDALSRISPILGMSPLLLLGVLLAGLFYVVHRFSIFGQYLRFAGEHPKALESQGVSVKRVRFISLLVCGALCGIAGTYLSIEHGSGFSRSMTAGRGFIALAALILGRWTPQGAILSSLLFGVIETCQIQLQGLEYSQGQAIPVQFIQMIPYIATLFILGGFLKEGMRVPRALGKSFILLFAISTLLAGCTQVDQFKGAVLKNLGSAINKTRDVPPTRSNEKSFDELTTSVNAEFLKEVYFVIFERSISETEFIQWWDPISQGASYEGIYNGLVYGSEYSEKEKGIAPPPVIKWYVDIISIIRFEKNEDESSKAVGTSSDIYKESLGNKPDVPRPESDHNITLKKIDYDSPEIILIRTNLGKKLLEEKKSTYTLKRWAAEEFIKLVDLKSRTREELASFYGRWTARINLSGIDFGLPFRNEKAEYEHYRWALKADFDRIKWEGVNRIHRLMNKAKSP